MLEIFTLFSDWFTFDILGLTYGEKRTDAVHFFVEDTSKILVLLVLMIYCISILRAGLNVERVRDYLSGKKRVFGYITGSLFGAITPFCSCSSIPLFLGFTSAQIPLGITMAFLITSPLINEIAVVLLFSLLGWKFTLAYVSVGMLIGVLSGWLLDGIGAERWLKVFVRRASQNAISAPKFESRSAQVTSFTQRHQFAKQETLSIARRVWKWVLIGVGIGAGLHGYVPDNWFAEHLGSGELWSVPAAVFLAIPLYSNATGIIPIMESLLRHGLPLGTTLAFCMSTVAASIPEFVMLKQVMEWKLLALLFGLLLVAFSCVGWIFNLPIWQ